MFKTALLSDREVNKMYIDHIEQCGGVAVTEFKQPEKECDCLVICGGGDMHPRFYGQNPILDNMIFNVGYDEYELSVIGRFIKAGKPILGICRGMQSINVAMGGTLIQDIPSQLGLCHYDCGNGICMHEIKISRKSDLSKSMGIRSIVNSFHHQCVHMLGGDLVISAASHDGIIEAVESNSLPILGVQWHPERMSGNTLFEYFLQKYIGVL